MMKEREREIVPPVDSFICNFLLFLLIKSNNVVDVGLAESLKSPSSSSSLLRRNRPPSNN
jgi:hypothetical protein